MFVCVEINSLWVSSFARVSSIHGCLFLSLMVSFAVQMLLRSTRSHLFVFVLFVLILSCESKQNFAALHVTVCSAFCFRSSIVSVLLFIYFVCVCFSFYLDL